MNKYALVAAFLAGGGLGAGLGQSLAVEVAQAYLGQTLQPSGEVDAVDQQAVEASVIKAVLGEASKKFGIKGIDVQPTECVLSTLCLHWYQDHNECKMRYDATLAPIKEAWISK